MNLIPIFYGKDPASLVARTANKLSFLDFYLPNHQSMIVYEYERLTGEVCCSVIYRREGGRQYAYRFIMGAAADTIFSPSLDATYERSSSASDILKYELQKLDVDVSNQIVNTLDYRSIIQGDPASSGKRKARNAAFSMGREMSRFSLGATGERLQHIESLTAMAFNNGDMLSSLKEMIVDTMIQSSTAVTAPEKNSKNQDLWEDLNSLREFERESGALRKGLGAYTSLQEAHGQLAIHRKAINEVAQEAGVAMREHESRIEAISDQADSLEDAQRNERYRRNRKIDSLKSEIDHLVEWLDSLQASAEVWEAEGVEEARLRAEDKPTLDREQVLARELIVTLTAQASEIESRFRELFANAERVAQKEERGLLDRRDGVSDKQKAQAHRHADQNMAFYQQCQNEMASLRENHEKALAGHQNVIDDLHQELAGASQALPSEEEDLAASQEVVDMADSSHEHLKEQELLARRTMEEARQKRDSRTTAASEAERETLLQQQRMDDLQDKLTPADGTLLSFLRGSELPWHDTLGKVLAPSLLHRKDLSPRLASTEAPDQAFGLQLDLGALSRPESAEDDEVLQAQMDRCEASLRRASDEAERCADKAHTAMREFQACEKAASYAVDQTTKGSDKLRSAKASHADLTSRLRQAGEARRKAVQEKVQQAQAKKQTALDACQRAYSDLGAGQSQQQQQINADHQAEEQRLEDEHTYVSDQLKDLTSKKKAKKRELEKQYAQAFTDEGVDASEIRRARELETSLTKQLDRIEKDAFRIRQYDAWRVDHWSKKPQREKELSVLQRKYQSTFHDRQVAEEEYKSEMETLAAQKRDHRRDADKLKKDIKSWGELAAQARMLIEDIPAPAPDRGEPELEAPKGNADQVVAELHRLVGSAYQGKNEVTRAATMCNRLLGRHPKSQVYKEWQAVQDHRRTVSRYSEGSAARDIETMQDIETLLDHKLPNIERALIVNIHAVGAVLHDYYEDLNNLDRAVSRASKQLSRHLNTDHDFDVISDLSVSVSSKIHELGFWNELTAFSKEWDAWVSSGANTLPKRDLLDRIMLIEREMANAQMNTGSMYGMVELEIAFYEQDRYVPIRTNADLGAASSKGISRLAIMILFSSLTRYLCPNPAINLSWPIDELGELATGNIDKLFDMMHQRNISLFCAEPKFSPELQDFFDDRIFISKEDGVRIIVPGEQEGEEGNPLLAHIESEPMPPRADVEIEDNTARYVGGDT